ncbi:MAG: hypothetical protein ABFS46_11390, partial [Myxococcota bacterium]
MERLVRWIGASCGMALLAAAGLGWLLAAGPSSAPESGLATDAARVLASLPGLGPGRDGSLPVLAHPALA